MSANIIIKMNVTECPLSWFNSVRRCWCLSNQILMLPKGEAEKINMSSEFRQIFSWILSQCLLHEIWISFLSEHLDSHLLFHWVGSWASFTLNVLWIVNGRLGSEAASCIDQASISSPSDLSQQRILEDVKVPGMSKGWKINQMCKLS